MALEYLESQKYYNPNKDNTINMAMADPSPIAVASMFNKKGKEREQAVEEAMVWGENCRNKGKQIAIPSSSSSPTD